MQKFKKFALLSLFAVLGLKANAQDKNIDGHQITIEVPEVALLDIETNDRKDFTSSFPVTVEAGAKLTAAESNSFLWLNYSSVLNRTDSRRIDVKASTLVAGVDVIIEAGKSVSGAGTLGVPMGSLILTKTDQTIINKIGSAYTNTGAKNGHQLTYTFSTPDATYANLRAGSTAVAVTYTLADN